MTAVSDTVPEKIPEGDAAVTDPVILAGTAVWRDDVMTDTDARSPSRRPPRRPRAYWLALDRLAAELYRRTAGRRGPETPARSADVGMATGGALDPSAGSIRDAGSAPSDVGRASARLAPVDETSALFLLVALVPEMRTMARWAVRRGAEPEDAQASAMAACWLAFAEHGAPTPAAVARRAWPLHRAQVRAERRRSGAVPLHLVDDVALPPVAGPSPPFAGLLAEARRAGALSAYEARVLGALYTDDRPVVDVAAAEGRSVEALWKAKRRAERALGDFLRDGPR